MTSLSCVLVLCAAPGCRREEGATASGTPEEATAQPQPAQRDRQAATRSVGQDWTSEEALRLLGRSDTAVRAALRLVELAGEHPVCVAAAESGDTSKRLHVLRVNDDWWALGLATEDRRTVASPVLIGADGFVVQPVKADEVGASHLVVSDDPRLFPHLLIAPMRVVIIADELRPALVGRHMAGVHFEYARGDDRPTVLLVLDAPAEKSRRRVAEYRWDPYEAMFMGPLADRLPDPPGGRFELDLQASEALVPVGGEISEQGPSPPTQQGPG